MLFKTYNGKKVLITGNTGFKGSWLTVWLLKLGAKVCGVSDEVPTKPSMFEQLNLEKKIEHHYVDIRDLDKLQEVVNKFKPDFIFHLAAQAIVSKSYESPLDTITTNVIGTSNILESVKNLKNKCSTVIITSDKCYENVEWEWGYKETDHLGGKDVYSASKGAAEMMFHSYYHSFFKNNNSFIKIGSARAGNVIGGGDWAKDRIVVDCIKSWTNQETVEIRSPDATRPWQHVLEPLSGYLTLGVKLYQDDEKLSGESFNFGPKAEQNRTVLELIKDLSDGFIIKNNSPKYEITDNIPFHEAGLLKLNCDKALFHLKWEANLNYHQCINLVRDWYLSNINGQDMYSLTLDQIDFYEKKAEESNLHWALN